MGKRTILIVAATVLILLLAACSSDETTTSTAAGTGSSAELNPVAVPADVAALVDDWYAALERQDDSVLDLYVPQGYHLYGDQRIELEDIPSHMSQAGWQHDWTTPTVLMTDEGDGRYVVARGVRNTSPTGESWASAVLFEIVTTADEELRLAQTAWFHNSEWTP